MPRAATLTSLLVASLLVVLDERTAAAKSAFFEIDARCPCSGPSPRVFWTSVADRLACVDAALADLRQEGWPDELLARDRRREQRSRCGDPKLRCDGTPAMPCPRGRMCDVVDPSCRPDGAVGICASRKRTARQCRQGFVPVCGCDGQTYPNQCRAQRAGVTVAFGLRCEQLCGGPDRIPCGPGETCVSVPSCDGADAFGACVNVGTPCDENEACGCDGTTYPTRCDLEAAGVARRNAGSCPGS